MAGKFCSNIVHQNFSATPYKSSTVWILDSGATDHMVCSLSSFSSFLNAVNTFVHLPNGNSVPVTYTGLVSISPDITLHNVLYVPSFNFNLISTSKLTAASHIGLIFLSNKCLIQDLHAWRTIEVANQKDGLYLLDISSVSLPTAVFNSADSTCLSFLANNSLWHLRLGHMSQSRMSLLQNVIPIVKESSQLQCEICPLAKQHRSPFPISSIKTSQPFAVVHCDIWGPFNTPTTSGHRYFLTVVYDFTRCTWVFLMFQKSILGLL